MVRIPNAGSRDTYTLEAAEPPATGPRPSAWGGGQKSMLVAYLLHLMGGGGIFGFHRFYLGYTRSAQIQAALGATTLLLPLIIRSNDFQLFLLPPAMLWYVVDLFLIPRMVRARNGEGPQT